MTWSPGERRGQRPRKPRKIFSFPLALIVLQEDAGESAACQNLSLSFPFLTLDSSSTKSGHLSSNSSFFFILLKPESRSQVQEVVEQESLQEMASGGSASAGPGPPTLGAPPGKMVPRDIVVMQSMLREMGITKFDARILVQMHEFVYRNVTAVAEEAKVYSAYAKKKSVDIDDMRLAIKVMGGKNYTTVPPRDLLLDLAKSKNSIPLPLIKATSGLRLPPDRFCLTQPNYRLQFNKKSIASSSLMSSSRFPTTPPSLGSQPLFKTPSSIPLRTVVMGGSPGESPDGSKKPKMS